MQQEESNNFSKYARIGNAAYQMTQGTLLQLGELIPVLQQFHSTILG